MQSAASPHQGLAVWCTGLSGAGKTTLCRALEPELRAMGYTVEVVDGDEVRRHLSRDLGFSKADRDENIMRIGSMVKPLVQQGVIVLVAAISPYREARLRVKEQVGSFLEVYVNASLATCIKRDPKQLYARALRGELHNFTGIEDLYEPPLAADVECNTDQETCDESSAKVLAAILETIQRNPILPREA